MNDRDDLSVDRVDDGLPVLGGYDERLADMRDADAIRAYDRTLEGGDELDAGDGRYPGPRCDLNGHYYYGAGGQPARNCLHCGHFAEPFHDEREQRVKPGDEIESNLFPGVRRRVLSLWYDRDAGTDASLHTERICPEAQPLDRVRLGDWRIVE